MSFAASCRPSYSSELPLIDDTRQLVLSERHCYVLSHRQSVIRGHEDSMKHQQVKSKGDADHAGHVGGVQI